ncbi:MarC family protein [Kiritimatiellota bacterium B12222]|nr:MarC family protein [Kiritimatiellota bacterium B12222]
MLNFTEIYDWNDYLKLFTALMAMTLPPVLISIFLGLTAHLDAKSRNKVAFYAWISFSIVIVTLAYTGESILRLFDISIDGFQIAGGLLLLLMGIEMMRKDITVEQADPEAEHHSLLALGIVPLTIPILAGPGTMSTVIVFASEHQGFTHHTVVATTGLLVTCCIYLMLRLASKLHPWFTPTVSQVFSRIMGLILASIGVEFIMHGLAGHFPLLGVNH